MSVLPLLAVIMAIAAFCGSAAAQSALSQAALQACDALTAKVVKATGADVLGRSPTGLQVYLSSPFAKDISLECVDPANPSYAHPAFSASFDNDHPSLPYYDTLAIGAGVALGFFVSDVREAAESCQEKALASANETATIDAGGHIHIDCHAFSRDGGGTSIGVFWDKKR